MAKRFDPNSVTIGGRIARKPELRYTPNQKAVTNITLANNQGEYNGQDVVYWPDVVIWGSKAEKLCENLDKGSYVIVEGIIQTRQVDDQSTGKKRTVTEIVAEQVFWMDNVGGSSNNTANNNSNQSSSYDQSQTSYNQSQPNTQQSQPNYQQSSQQVQSPPNPVVPLQISDDDIPF